MGKLRKPILSSSLLLLTALLAAFVMSPIVQAQTDDFTMTPTSKSLTVSRGSSLATRILFDSVGGFTGSVTLASSIEPAKPHAPSVTLDPTSVFVCALCASIVAPSSTLTATAAKNAMKGIYIATVTGTSGAIIHSIIIQITVTS